MILKELYDGTKIPALGLGTWGIGGKYKADKSQESFQIESIKYAISKGITHIDTAEYYGAGLCEEIVGGAISEFNRNDLFITSKVWKTNLKYNDVINSLNQTLKRLNTGYLDAYLIHWPNPETPLKETIRALDYLKDEGLIKFIGVCNFSLDLLKEAESYTKHKIALVQGEYNLFNKDIERETLYYCQKNKILFTAYKPVARGDFTNSNNQLLEELSRKYSATKTQIALSWLLSKQQVVAIPKSSNIQHLEENIKSLDIKLEKEDIERLDYL